MNQQVTKQEGIELKRGIIYKVFHYPFGEAGESANINDIKQNIHILKENQLM